MTIFLLVRHAEHTRGREMITGRSADVTLSVRGRHQAAGLADRLAGLSLAAIYASPLERTMETARPLAERRGLAVQRCEELLEVDYGD